MVEKERERNKSSLSEDAGADKLVLLLDDG